MAGDAVHANVGGAVNREDRRGCAYDRREIAIEDGHVYATKADINAKGKAREPDDTQTRES